MGEDVSLILMRLFRGVRPEFQSHPPFEEQHFTFLAVAMPHAGRFNDTIIDTVGAKKPS